MLEAGLEPAPALRAQRLLERDGLALQRLLQLLHGLGSHAQSTGEFGQRRLPPQLYEQGVERLAVLAGALDDVHGQADCARLVGKGARDRLTDPPGGVGAELEAAPVVELLDAADEAGVPFLAEVEQRQG